MDIKIVRLITGEELLSEVVFRGPQTVKVKRPVRIMVMPSKDNPREPSVALAPFGEFAAEKEFEFDMSHVLLVYDPVVEFKNQYQKMFGGILTPPTQKLIVPD